MYGINKVQLLGNVGQSPEIRFLPDGKKVAAFSLATTEYGGKDRDTGKRREFTEWHRVTVFGGAAEIVEKFVDTGSRLFVEGKLKTEKWQDKETGQTRFGVKIVVGSFGTILLQDARKEGEPLPDRHPPVEEDPDNIPF